MMVMTMRMMKMEKKMMMMVVMMMSSLLAGWVYENSTDWLKILKATLLQIPRLC